MSSFPLNEVGAFIKSYDGNAGANAGAPSLITAGGGLDNLKVNGQNVNRLNGTALAHSAVAATSYLAALGAAETLSLAHEIQESANGSSYDTAEVIQAATVVATDSGAGSNMRGVSEHDVSLRARKQHFRINVTPNMSRANTDTCTFHTLITLGGWTQVPQ
mgnify:CR=1 FL=1